MNLFENQGWEGFASLRLDGEAPYIDLHVIRRLENGDTDRLTLGDKGALIIATSKPGLMANRGGIQMPREVAQAVVDALYDMKIRPQKRGSESEMEIMKDHLADMRKLVFLDAEATLVQKRRTVKGGDA